MDQNVYAMIDLAALSVTRQAFPIDEDYIEETRSAPQPCKIRQLRSHVPTKNKTTAILFIKEHVTEVVWVGCLKCRVSLSACCDASLGDDAQPTAAAVGLSKTHKRLRYGPAGQRT